jgi:hypothetical protein
MVASSLNLTMADDEALGGCDGPLTQSAKPLALTFHGSEAGGTFPSQSMVSVNVCRTFLGSPASSLTLSPVAV